MQFQIQISCSDLSELKQLLRVLDQLGEQESSLKFAPEPESPIIVEKVEPAVEQNYAGVIATTEVSPVGDAFTKECLQSFVKPAKVRKPIELKDKPIVGENTCVVCFKPFEATSLSQKTCSVSCVKALWYRKSVIRKMNFNLKPEIVDAMALNHFIKKRSEGKVKDQRVRRVIPPSETPLELPIETNTVSKGIPNGNWEIIKVRGKDTQIFGTPEKLKSIKERLAARDTQEAKTLKSNHHMKRDRE